MAEYSISPKGDSNNESAVDDLLKGVVSVAAKEQDGKEGDKNAILTTKSLTRSFGDLTAVNSLTISVQAGEVFGLLGPNGAGKTTVIKMLTTLLPATSGSASIGGFEVAHHASKIRRIIGYVPQLLSADGALTGFENLEVFAKLYDIPVRNELLASTMRLPL